MPKILVTPRSFGREDEVPLDRLREAGYEVLRNPHGAILTREQMLELLPGCAGVIIGVDPLDRAVLEQAPDLRAIAKYGVGTDNIDLSYAASRRIPVSTTAGANAEAVADFTFALMLACARDLVAVNRRCHERDWAKVVGIDVYGATLGILGLGVIGRAVARRAGGFSMEVGAYDPFWDAAYADGHGIRRAEPEELYRRCDFISLHLPLTGQTAGMIGAAAFERMKPDAILINTARGGIVDEDALARALREGRIRAAGFDAFQSEPPELEALYTLPNLIMGSHAAASTRGAVRAMGRAAAVNLLRDLGPARQRGTPGAP